MKKKRSKRKSADKRRPILCSKCGHPMVCMNRFESLYKLMRGLYVWYICPHRKGETGCGHSVLIEIFPRSKAQGYKKALAVKNISLKHKIECK